MCHISDLILDIFLLFSIASIELSESVYITHFMSSLFFNSFIAVISSVWIDAFSDSAPLLVMSANTSAKPTFFPVLFDPSV